MYLFIYFKLENGTNSSDTSLSPLYRKWARRVRFFNCFCSLPFPTAVCNGRYHHFGNAPCTEYYRDDSITERTGKVERNSGGQCLKPEQCDNCNDGFYPATSPAQCKSKNRYITTCYKNILI